MVHIISRILSTKFANFQNKIALQYQFIRLDILGLLSISRVSSIASMGIGVGSAAFTSKETFSKE
jgi:hypothetical protein